MLAAMSDLYTSSDWYIQSTNWQVLDTGGSGLPLILLPGAQGTAEIYAAQFSSLADEMRIIGVTYPDLSDVSQLANAFEALLSEMDISRAVIVGSSYAGLWLQTFAARYPARIGGLVLANTFVSATPVFDFLDKMLSLDDDALAAGVLAGARGNESKSEEHGTLSELLKAMIGVRQSGAGLKARLRGVRTAPAAPVASVPDNRILIIDCENDPIVTESMRQEIADRYAQSERITIADGEHYPAVLSPGDYTAGIRKFHTAVSKLEEEAQHE